MLRIDYSDPVLDHLHVDDLTPYLRKTGWKLAHREPYFIFEGPLDDDGAPLEILLPKGNEEDNRRRIAEAISLLSAVEEKSPYDIIRSIQNINKDIIYVKLNLPSSYEQSISLNKATDFVKGITALFNYAASTEDEPAKYLPKSRKTGQKYVKDCRFGHTIKGSFGFAFESPVAPRGDVQLNMNGEPVEAPPPFERRVVIRLINGLKLVQEAVMEGNPDVISSNFEKGFNSNMCDIMSDVLEIFKEIETEYFVSWSPNWQPEETLLNARIRLDLKSQEYLKAAARTMRVTEESQLVSITGRITALKSSAFDSEDAEESEERTIVVEALSGDNVHASLNEADYRTACDAHRDKKIISIKGTLEKKGRFWWLMAPHDFSIVTENSQ